MKKLLCIILAIFTFFTLISCESIYNITDSTSENSYNDSATELKDSSTTESKPDAETEKKDEAKTDNKGDNEAENDNNDNNNDNTDDVKPEPQAPVLTLKGGDISEYKIVYYTNAKYDAGEQAQRLAEHIKDTFGVTVDIVTDPEITIEKAIIISDALLGGSGALTLDTLTSVIQSANDAIYISALNEYALTSAIDKLIADTTPSSPDEKISLTYEGEEKAVIKAKELGEPLKVMTYNVKNGYISAARKTNTVEDVMNFMPDTLGVQEFNSRWFKAFTEKGVFDEYEFVGEQRYGDRDPDANDNEYSAILYRKGKFKLLDSGTYWLSETPSVPDTKLEASKYVRIMTYVVLERLSDGVKFVHVNTHLNTTPELNLRQMEILIGLVNEKIYSKYGKLPTYFTGDFNASPLSTNNDGYKYLISTGTEDSRFVAEVTSDENTIKNGGMIDHCIVTKDDFLVTFFDVGNDKGDEETSNHYPVYVKMYILPQE